MFSWLCEGAVVHRLGCLAALEGGIEQAIGLLEQERHEWRVRHRVVGPPGATGRWGP